MAEIARRAGFVDRSYFHRVFRIRFGETPTDVREASARENTGRFVQASAEAVVDINLKQPKAARPRSRPLGFLH